MSQLRRLYESCAVRAFDALRDPVLLFTRAYWGWLFFLTGKGKLGNLGGVTDYFTTLGIPMPGVNAVFVSALECFGGALLIVGLFSRPIAALMVGNMVVAFLTADREALMSIFSDSDKFLAAKPMTFLFASLVTLAFGPGRVSIDWFLAKRRASANAKQ